MAMSPDRTQHRSIFQAGIARRLVEHIGLPLAAVVCEFGVTAAGISRALPRTGENQSTQ
jgi:hypothetical protein